LALSVVLAPAAARDLDRIAEDRRRQVIGDLEEFARAPSWRAPRVKRLRGFKPPLDRLRSGDYRILFRVVVDAIHAYRVIDRKDLDRALKAFRHFKIR